MTSYSIYRPDFPSDREDVREARFRTFLSGMCRELLDNAEIMNADGDHPEETQYAEAAWWHGPGKGWEFDAVHPDDRERVERFAREFFDVHFMPLAAVAARIEFSGHYLWDSEDWSWYRAGMVFFQEVSGGEGFRQYDGWNNPGGRTPGAELSEKCGSGAFRALSYPEGHRDEAYVRIEEMYRK